MYQARIIQLHSKTGNSPAIPGPLFAIPNVKKDGEFQRADPGTESRPAHWAQFCIAEEPRSRKIFVSAYS